MSDQSIVKSDTNASEASAPPPKRRARFWRWLPFVGIFAAIVIITWGVARSWPRSNAYFTDGADVRVPSASAQTRDVIWTEPRHLGEGVNAMGDDYEPFIDEPAATLYYVRGRTGENAEIYVSQRDGESWSPGEPLAEVNSPADELGPRLSADRLTLYFYSDRAGGQGGYDLWAAARATPGAPFGSPRNLGSRVNSAWDEYGAAPSPDGSTLYFASNRPRGDEHDAVQPDAAWSATLRDNRIRRDYDLYVADWSDAGYAPARPLDALNTPADDGAPAISLGGRFPLF
jgi:hypothetical protein